MSKKLENIIKTAEGTQPAELVLKNAQYLNVFTKEFLTGDIAVSDGVIAGIGEYSGKVEIDLAGKTVVPGFMDAHLHLESSIVVPGQYARAVVPHGTTAIVADPHEIANVLGRDGIDYMLAQTEKLPLHVYFMVPSCVPATAFDESGAEIDAETVKEYLKNERVLGLAEMMNYPGVLGCDTEVLKKMEYALLGGKRIDGHGPGLSGKELAAYAAAGAKSDHECVNLQEAEEKIRNGQYVMIREGTAGKNLANLVELLNGTCAGRCLFATDDKHPGELKEDGHIDYIIRKAISLGANPVNCYLAASYQAAEYFGLKNQGAIAPGYQADFVVLDDIREVTIDSVYQSGVCLSKKGVLTEDGERAFVQAEEKSRSGGEEDITAACSCRSNKIIMEKISNTIHIGEIHPSQLKTKNRTEKVIGVVGGELLTTDCGEVEEIATEKDILKLCVAERHKNTGHIGVAYVKGYGLKTGAVATSIAHDSHNIIAVGASDAEIAFAINRLAACKGGMVVVKGEEVLAELPLPIAGLMCDLEVSMAQKKLDEVKEAAYSLGASREIDPFMTLSFTSLPVIPKLRLTTHGVFDVEAFRLV